jgi:pimeloyl-ACP methyl ester carboxylesterase
MSQSNRIDEERRAIIRIAGAAVVGGVAALGASSAVAEGEPKEGATAHGTHPQEAQHGLKQPKSGRVDKVVLVHGAFADGSCWAKVIPLLTKRGLKAVAVQNPLSSLADDVRAVHRVVEAQKGPVLLVGHSWGGAVITEAGNHPHVKGLVYIAAGAPDTGQSFADWWKDYPPPPGRAEIKPYGEGYVALTLEGVRKHFVQDVPAGEADIVFATQGPLAVRCFSDTVSKAAWRSKPASYIVAAHDETIPPAVERDSAKRMGAKTLVLESSHVPMLSQPAAVAEVIAHAAAAL